MNKTLQQKNVLNIILCVILMGISIALIVLGSMFASNDIGTGYVSKSVKAQNTYGADYYTDSYEAAAATANNTVALLSLTSRSLEVNQSLTVAFGLFMLFAGLIMLVVCLFQIIKCATELKQLARTKVE